jgi:histone H3/H4
LQGQIGLLESARLTSLPPYPMSYVVASKIKELVKKHNMMAAGDLAEAASTHLENALKAAVKRAGENGRKTVRPCDL